MRPAGGLITGRRKIMNIKQYAKITADAYISQYITGEGRVMNDPMICMDADGYIWSQSSLTPLGEDEIVLETLSEGMFGNDPHVTARAIAHLIVTDDNFQPPFARE